MNINERTALAQALKAIAHMAKALESIQGTLPPEQAEEFQQNMEKAGDYLNDSVRQFSEEWSAK
jgi:hypothetical protein